MRVRVWAVTDPQLLQSHFSWKPELRNVAFQCIHRAVLRRNELITNT